MIKLAESWPGIALLSLFLCIITGGAATALVRLTD